MSIQWADVPEASGWPGCERLSGPNSSVYVSVCVSRIGVSFHQHEPWKNRFFFVNEEGVIKFQAPPDTCEILPNPKETYHLNLRTVTWTIL